MCRICLEEGGGHFCSCTGTCALVHAECLQKWIDISGRDKCEICLARYQFPKKCSPRFRMKISDLRFSEDLKTSAVCALIGCILFLINFVFAIIFKCFTANILASNVISILCVSFSLPFTHSLQLYIFFSLLTCMGNTLVVYSLIIPFNADLYLFFSQCALTIVLIIVWFARILWRSSWVVSTISI